MLLDVLRNGAGAEEGLDGLRSVAVSADGRYVYGVGVTDEALTVFARNPSGALIFIQVIGGIAGASAVSASPDGVHVYVAGGDAITTFARGSDGRLTPIAVVVNGLAGVSGIGGVQALAISPDGFNLYAAGFADDAVAVFRRDPLNGQLAFLQAVPGMLGAAAVAVSPDGASVYVGRFDDATIAVFARAPQTGVLSGIELERESIGGVTGLTEVSALAVSPDGERLYAVGTNAMTVFARAASDGRLGFIEAKSYFTDRVGCPAAPVAAVAVSEDHRFVYAARALDTGVAVFERDAGSSVLVLRSVYDDERGGRGCDGGFSLAPFADDASGAQLYTSGVADDRLVVLTSDVAGVGALAFAEEHRNGIGGVDGLTGASALAVSPDQRYIYVAAAPGSLAVFARSDVSGELRFVEVQRDGVDGVSGLGAVSTVAVSPDGTGVYVATAGDSLVAFARDPETGRLAFAQELRNGAGGVTGLAGDSAVRVSPDAAHVYVASRGDNAVAVFARDPATSALAFLGEQRQGVNGVDGIAEASALALSADGRHVYVTGARGTLALFARDVDTGELGFVVAYVNRVSGIDGLGGASAVEISPRGSHVYVAGFLDAAIAIFARNGTTGALGFLSVQRDAAGGSLAGVTALALSPDGERLYSVSIGGALSAFARSAGVGALTLLETYRDGVAGIDGLGGARSVVTAGDGRSIYVTGSTDSAVAVFAASD